MVFTDVEATKLFTDTPAKSRKSNFDDEKLNSYMQS